MNAFNLLKYVPMWLLYLLAHIAKSLLPTENLANLAALSTPTFTPLPVIPS
ncbi:MAG: hypothetical protein U1E92_05660 [Moraxella osloensis]